MNLKNKIHKGWYALIFVVFHFVCIVIYAFPSHFMSPKLQEVAGHYVSPVFEQKWNMFAPAPLIQSTIEVKYFFQDGDSSNWIRPAYGSVQNHLQTRILYYGELALVESNVSYWIKADMTYMDLYEVDSLTGEQWSEFRKGYSYRKLTRFIKGFSKVLDINNIQSYIVRFNHKNVKTGDKGILYLPQVNI